MEANSVFISKRVVGVINLIGGIEERSCEDSGEECQEDESEEFHREKRGVFVFFYVFFLVVCLWGTQWIGECVGEEFSREKYLLFIHEGGLGKNP